MSTLNSAHARDASEPCKHTAWLNKDLTVQAAEERKVAEQAKAADKAKAADEAETSEQAQMLETFATPCKSRAQYYNVAESSDSEESTPAKLAWPGLFAIQIAARAHAWPEPKRGQRSYSQQDRKLQSGCVGKKLGPSPLRRKC